MAKYRSGLMIASGVALAALLAQPACAGQDRASPDAYAAYQAGRYDDAIRGLRALARADASDHRARRTLVAALSEVGRYDEAEAAARESASPELANALGEVLLLRGRLDEASQAFRRSIEAGATDHNTARLNLALIDAANGKRDAALDEFDTFIDLYNNSTRLSARDLMAVAEAVRQLGVRDAQLYQDAVKALDEALAEDDGIIDGTPVALEARVRMALLFLEKYESTEAQGLFREVLADNENHPGALLGLAMAKNFDGSAESLDLVEQSLEVNPDNVKALTFRARLMLDLERTDDAREDIDKALSVNPRSLDALAARATADWLAGDDTAYDAARAAVLGIDPQHADLYNRVAELAVRQRRYAGAVDLARQAIELDPRSWEAWGILGLNELRLGRVEQARANLETSFAGDPYNPWIKNTLDLLDTFAQYRIVRTERFELMLHESEADLLAPWISELAEEAYESLAKRYGYRPEPPIRVEVFPNHADFSVRTVGLAGLGALGVCFGNVLAIDSPSARDRGEFNWGSTLWHELAHTITLGITDHRVPRWLTEGLSVLEERRARPGWGDDLTPHFLAAYKGGDVLPVSRLSQGFVRPKFPEQVAFSYYQASLVAQMIEEQRGFDMILAMLQAYRDGRSDSQVFEEVLGTKPEEFDDRFDDWLRERFATQLAAVPAREGDGGLIERAMGTMRAARGGGFTALLEQGRELAQQGKSDEAREAFERAKAQFPEYIGPGNAYQELATLYLEAGDDQAAARELAALTAINENDYGANVGLAGLLERLGDPAAAAAALERAIYISPYDKSLHERMATLHGEAGDLQGVVRSRRALVALDPVDRADALYQLALALSEAGDLAAARSEVIRSLELAPNFEKAQELLLRLRSGGGPPSRTREERSP